MSVWLLPENIADMLPREARVIEAMRSSFLSLVTSHGFEIVRPPLVEYVDSLLTGTGGDLDLRTFKIVDQVSGRTMGIRADMTPQVARIDAHILNREGVSRLCYVGSVRQQDRASDGFTPAVCRGRRAFWLHERLQ